MTLDQFLECLAAKRASGQTGLFAVPRCVDQELHELAESDGHWAAHVTGIGPIEHIPENSSDFCMNTAWRRTVKMVTERYGLQAVEQLAAPSCAIRLRA